MNEGKAKRESMRCMVTKKQKEAALARAEKLDMTESEYLRYLILRDIEENS